MHELIQIDEVDHAARQELSKNKPAAAAANLRPAVNALVAECEKELGTHKATSNPTDRPCRSHAADQARTRPHHTTRSTLHSSPAQRTPA
jgi:hypothetical protein